MIYNTSRMHRLLLGDSRPLFDNDVRDGTAEKYFEQKEHWTNHCATTFREETGTDWCLAEAGASGPTFNVPISAGFTSLSVAGPGGILQHSMFHSETSDREANMVAFSEAAARFLMDSVEQAQ